MNLTDELAKLADMRDKGHLSEEEFAAAKKRLLADAPAQMTTAPWSPRVTAATLPPFRPATPVPDKSTVPPIVAEDRVFWSSRWSSGNLFFRDRVTAADDGIVFRKGKMIGSKEEHISYRAIASLKVDHRTFLSDITIETAGGSQPVFINGLWKSDAKELQELIRNYQAKEYKRL